MNLGELVQGLDPYYEGLDALDFAGRIKLARTVKLRIQNVDEFVWVEAELTAVELNSAAPDIVLIARISPQEEEALFQRIDEEGDPLI